LTAERVFVVVALICCIWSLASVEEYRSRAIKQEFQRHHPCPSTGRTTGACPGYAKDYIVPFACGGPDTVANLQWQRVAAAKAKDRWEQNLSSLERAL
jgi:hypothetical protein